MTLDEIERLEEKWPNWTMDELRAVMAAARVALAGGTARIKHKRIADLDDSDRDFVKRAAKYLADALMRNKVEDAEECLRNIIEAIDPAPVTVTVMKMDLNTAANGNGEGGGKA